MKRILLHVLFWIAYLAQDTLLAFFLEAGRHSHLSVNEQVLLAIENCSVFLLPKLLFTYYMLYVGLPKILKRKNDLLNNILHVGVALVVTLLLYRALSAYFLYPVIYHQVGDVPPFFFPLGFLVAFMDVGFASGSAIVIKQIRLQIAGKEQEKFLIREKLETELKFLKNQTNPHFLFNTLNNIYALARKKSDNTADVVMKLSKILRFMIYESSKQFITLAEEVRLLEDYLDLERIRYNERLNIIFRKEIDDDMQRISPLLLLPFVENAFKHGVSETRFNSFVNIDLSLKNYKLSFRIQNSKENTTEHQADSKIGLCNVRRQLELMYKEFDLNVVEDETTFTVNLIINLNSHAKI